MIEVNIIINLRADYLERYFIPEINKLLYNYCDAELTKNLPGVLFPSFPILQQFQKVSVDDYEGDPKVSIINIGKFKTAFDAQISLDRFLSIMHFHFTLYRGAITESKMNLHYDVYINKPPQFSWLAYSLIREYREEYFDL